METQQRDARPRLGSIVRAVVLAWLLVIGVDFFVNGGLLARLWEEPLPFLLPIEYLFVRIPMGYAALLLWSVLVVWHLVRLEIGRPRDGAVGRRSPSSG